MEKLPVIEFKVFSFLCCSLLKSITISPDVCAGDGLLLYSRLLYILGRRLEEN